MGISSTKEKANELVETYMWQVIPPVGKSQAVQYSILAVDEILKDNLIINNQEAFGYYFEVRQHLEEML